MKSFRFETKVKKNLTSGVEVRYLLMEKWNSSLPCEYTQPKGGSASADTGHGREPLSCFHNGVYFLFKQYDSQVCVTKKTKRQTNETTDPSHDLTPSSVTLR